MKILNVRIKNIHSLKGEHFIDFDSTPLSGSGIIAITGVTGAGKSSILDAICLALFNQIPRIGGTISKTILEEMGTIVTRGSHECFSEVEYECDTKRFRSKWLMHSKKDGKIRDYEMSLVSLPEQIAFDLKKSAVPDKNSEIIGLNYEQFVKSIILAQGEFAKFVHAKHNEKSDLLEKITGTEIYRTLGKHLFEICKEKKMQIEKLDDRIKSFNILEDDQIAEINKNIIKIDAEITKIHKDLQSQNEQLNLKKQWNQLVAKLKASHKSKEQIELELDLHKEHIKKFNLYELLIPYLAQINQHQGEKDRLVLLKKEKESSLKIIEQHNLAQAKFVQEKVLKEKNLKDVEQKILESKPMLLKVREFDQRLSNLKVVLDEKKNQLEDLSKKKKLLDNEISKLHVAINQSNDNLTKTELWLSENAIYKYIKEDFNKISDLLTEKSEIEKIAHSQIDRKPELKKLLQNENKWSDKYKTLNNYKTKLTDQKNSLIVTDKDLESIVFLDQEIENLRNKEQKLVQILDLSNKHGSQITKVQEIEKTCQSNENEANELKKQSLALSDNIEIQTKLLQELSIRKDRQMLEKKYDADRQNLKKDESCPLCGSKNHPWVEHYTNNADETQSEIDKTQKFLTETKLELDKKDKIIVSLCSKTEVYFKQKKTYETEISQLENKFLSVKGQLEEEFGIQDIDLINSTLEKLKIKQHSKQEKLKSLKQFESLGHEILHCEGIIEKVVLMVKISTNLKEFFDKYKIKYESNEKTLETLNFKSKEFENNTRTLEEIKSAITKDTVLINEKKSNVSEYNLQIEALTTQFASDQSTFSELHQVRYSMLKVKPEEYEDQLNKELQNSTGLLKSVEHSLLEVAKDIENQNNILKQKEIEFNTLEEGWKNRNLSLEIEINKLNVNNLNESLQIIDFEKSNRHLKEKIKQKQQNLNESVLMIEKLLKEKELLQNELNSDLEQSDIEAKILELNDKNKTITETIGSLKMKLVDNDKKINDLFEIKKNLEGEKLNFVKWQRLNEFIGDATGTKFSKIAQAMTLSQLIVLSNEHLKNLNDRYSLKVKERPNNEQEILIMDTWQGNAERSVKTLSGGETFLVSLALALGLSDLARQKAKISCLFIDEGFGSLDQGSLDIAIDALERLQNQTNRTIAIISHVEMLKERIRTQIQVIKSSTGFSKIEVVSG